MIQNLILSIQDKMYKHNMVILGNMYHVVFAVYKFHVDTAGIHYRP